MVVHPNGNLDSRERPVSCSFIFKTRSVNETKEIIQSAEKTRIIYASFFICGCFTQPTFEWAVDNTYKNRLTGWFLCCK